MKKPLLILKTSKFLTRLGFVLICIQVLAFLIKRNSLPVESTLINNLAYYIGFKAMLLVPVTIFLISIWLRLRYRKYYQQKLVDSIGKGN